MEFQFGSQQMKTRNAKLKSMELSGLNCKEEASGSFAEPRIGMTVKSENEAYEFYNRYAIRAGFSVRKGTQRWNKGTLRQREFLCSKAGYKEFEDPAEVKKFNHLETRTGCKALIRFTIENGLWVVTSFNSQHNHELAIAEERCNLRSGRRITDASGVTIQSMVNSGIKPIKSFNFLSKEVGGQNNVGFTKRDMHNFLRNERGKMIEAGDAQSLFGYFQQRQNDDAMFFYSVQVDQFNRMANFFWCDSRSRLDYDAFGDVVIFDTTYRTNRYNLICAPFVGINHHWKNVLFGYAFLLDETTESFIWLFETFKDAMGGRQPKTIFTDQDQAMANAIETAFPLSCHRLCLWHISKNARQHLAGLYANADFYKKFNKCLSGCLNEKEFDDTWEEMIQTHKLQGNTWLSHLHRLRKKWCPAFSVDIFSARMKSTQRSESTNSVFHQIMRTSMPLVQVIRFYEDKAEEMRQNELNEDFRCKNGTPAKVTNYGGILRQAAGVYTLVLYKMFEEEFLEASGLSCMEVGTNGMNSIYNIQKSGYKREYIVQFDRSALVISCSCKLFETLGLLCSHALRVFIVNNVNELPSKYIMERWTKSARNRVAQCFEASSKNDKSTRTLRLRELNYLGQRVFDKGSISIECANIVEKKLREAMELIEKELSNSNQLMCTSQKSPWVTDKGTEGIILDPPCIRKKGLTNARIRSNMEKKVKRKRKALNTFTMPFHRSENPNSTDDALLEPNFSLLRLLQENDPTLANNQTYYSNVASLSGSTYMSLLQESDLIFRNNTGDLNKT